MKATEARSSFSGNKQDLEKAIADVMIRAKEILDVSSGFKNMVFENEQS